MGMFPPLSVAVKAAKYIFPLQAFLPFFQEFKADKANALVSCFIKRRGGVHPPRLIQYN